MAKKTAKSTKRSGKSEQIPVERVQLGVRMERSMVKVLKAMAEYGDMPLGELLEDLVLHSFEGGSAQTFGTEDLKLVNEARRKIARKKYSSSPEALAAHRDRNKIYRTYGRQCSIVMDNTSDKDQAPLLYQLGLHQ